MRSFFQLAAAGLLSGVVAAGAQITNPDTLIAPPPKPPAQHQRPGTMSTDLQWLWAFTRPAPIGRADDLRLDPRFQDLLKRSFKQPQAMWGSMENPPSLATVIPLFLTQYGEVTAEQDRILTVDGCVPSFCPAHGMLWIDLGTAHPLMVFVGVNWTTENRPTDDVAADYDLWLFPSRNLPADAFPLELAQSISRWDARLAAAHRLVPHIARAVIVEPDGTPQALDPQLAGANTLKPQPDTVTPKEANEN